MDHAQVSDTWERGDAYEQYIGRWSRRVAPLFLAWLRMPAGLRWLDIGCGTGALCAAIADTCLPASVTGVEPSPGFLEAARQNLADRAALLPGNAAQVPLGDSAVDVTVSGLVLNFVPDLDGALAEMVRVTSNGGTIGAYVWDYAGRMEFLRIYWDAVVELDPQAAGLDEGIRFPLCHPERLQELFAGAGLAGVETTSIDIPTHFASFAAFWQPFEGGQGPAPAYAMALDESARRRLRENLQARLPVEADGSISLTARAWAVRATLAK